MTLSKSYNIAVLGGGLAGTSAAWALKNAGHHPVIVAPQGLADGASGNLVGLYNPRASKHWTGIAQTHAIAWARFHHFLSTHDPDQTGWHENGALHLFHDADQADRLSALITVWGWTDDAVLVNADQGSDIAGIKITQNGIWLPCNGSVSPAKICALYANSIEIRPDMPDSYDAIVIATGADVLAHPHLGHLPIKTVRGQLSFMRANDISSQIKTNLCYGGYVTPAHNGTHILGATFQQWLTTTDVRADDHTYVRDKLHAMVGPIFTPGDVIGGRASLRVVARDHAPIVGAVSGKNDIPTYISTAHGSHGLITTHLAAQIIADLITGTPQSIPPAVIDTITPARFDHLSKI